jgi:hypothetical protein
LSGRWAASQTLHKLLSQTHVESLFSNWLGDQPDTGFFFAPSSALAYDKSYNKLLAGVASKPELTERLWDAYNILFSYLDTLVPEKNVVLTCDQIVEHLNLSASAGNGFHGDKRSVIDCEPAIIPRLLQECSAKLLAGEYMPIFNVFPKFEALPISKKLEKERVVANGPMDLHILTIKYTADTFDTLLLHHDQSPICIGMSKYYGEFTDRILRHKKFKHHFSLDIASLECCFTQEIHFLNSYFISRLCHTDPSLINITQLATGALREWIAVHSNGRGSLVEGVEPSGEPLTIWKNSIFVCAAIFATLLKFGFSPYDLIKLGEKYMLDIMGDDVRLSFDIEIDPVKFVNELATCGLCAKIENLSDNIFDHDFLSMKVTPNPRGYLINSTRPEKIVYSIHKGGFDPVKTYQIASSVRNEIYTDERYFPMLDRFCSYLEKTFTLPNLRSSVFTLNEMYGLL